MTKILSTSLILAFFLTACATKQQKHEHHEPTQPAAQTEDAQAKKDESTAQNDKHIKATTCTNGSDVRTLLISKKGPAGCELHYTKFDQMETSASSAVGTKYCENVKKKIESNLRAAGFNCN